MQELLTLDDAERLAEAALPADAWGYIAGELAQRASGRSLGTVLREDICEPLGLDFRIGTPDSEHVRCAEMKKPARGGDFGEITPPRKAAFFTPWAAPTRGSKGFSTRLIRGSRDLDPGPLPRMRRPG